MKYESEHSRYTKGFIILALLVQVIALLSLSMHFCDQDIHGFFSLPWGLSLLMVTFITYLWLKLSYPEKPIHPWCYHTVFTPYFVWLSFSLFSAPINLIHLFVQGGSRLLGTGELAYFDALMLIFDGLIFFITCYGTFFVPKRISKNAFTLTHQEKKFNGYRVLQISDIHVGNFISKRFLTRVIDEINAAQADLIVITGDLLTFGDHFIDSAVDFIAALQAQDGIIFSLGNHEAYVDTKLLITKLRNINCTVLSTELTSIERDGVRLNIGAISGVTNDLIQSRAELESLIEKNGGHPPDILLAHDGIVFSECQKKNLLLTLSGHTHGGQFAIPSLNINAARWGGHRFISGLYGCEPSFLYVNNGLGMSGLPIRIGVRPEIATFSLS